MTIRVLSPVTLREGQISGVPAAAKPRTALALLLRHANRVVPVSALMKELWDDNPPHSATTTLQTYVFRLRKLLADALGLDAADVARDVPVTKAGSYLFKVRPDELDLDGPQQSSGPLLDRLTGRVLSPL